MLTSKRKSEWKSFKSRKPMRRTGKKDRANVELNRDLKKEFEARNITRCERCGGDFGLAFAHRVKRRFITDTLELHTVALLCQPCHHWAEYGTREEPGTHERMKQIIDQIIQRRPI